MSKYILGCGISALCFAWYNREYTLIGEETGGRLNKQFFKNIIYFHKTPDTVKFLEDVGVKYSTRTQLIKYLKDGKLTQNITKEDKIKMIKKKMDDDKFEVRDVNLSTNDYYITILEFSFEELIAKIKNVVNIINDKIIRITEKEIITEKTSYEYSNIVNTLPADIFCKLWYKDKGLLFKKKPVTFVLANTQPAELENQTYDMVYCIDNDKKYTRISKKPGEREEINLLYEFTGVLSKEDALKYLPENSKILEYYIDYSGIIETNYNNFAPNKVLHVGRFAEFSHSLKQQDVLKTAQFDYDIRNLFSRTGYFTSNMIDFNKIKNNLEEQDKYAQTFILHLMGEIGEVLKELNYQMHHKKKELNKEKIHEELIDVFKYFLNLAIVLDMTPETFIKTFESKSDYVEKRYEQEFKHG